MLRRLAPPTGRRRRQRTIFSKDQVDILDQVFEKNQYPDIQLREQLSERLDVPEARIQVRSSYLWSGEPHLYGLGLVQKSSKPCSDNPQIQISIWLQFLNRVLVHTRTLLYSFLLV